jgi:hypothetical protein
MSSEYSPEREYLSKIVASRVFRDAETLCDLLRRLVEHSLENPGVPLKEVTIAGWYNLKGNDGKGYDPKIHSTIRERMSNLRKKLEEYYQTEGRDDEIRMNVPLKEYPVVFVPQSFVPQNKVTSPAATIEIAEVSMAEPAPEPEMKFEEPEIAPVAPMAADALEVPEYFTSWILQKKQWLLLPGFAALASTWLLYRAFAPPQEENWWYWLLAALSLQALVILVLLFCLPDPPTDDKRSSVAMRQFSDAWRKVWLFWFIEYLVLATNEFLKAQSGKGQPLEEWLAQGRWGPAFVGTAVDFANNLATLALVLCYVVASEKTVVVDRKGQASKIALPWDRATAILIAVTVFDFAARARFPAPSHLPSGFEWISGLAAGIATALLIGRLDSKFIGLPIWVMTFLYGYAVVQAGWPAFPENDAARAVLLNLAFPLKCLFFLVLLWLYQSGVFAYYIDEIGLLYEKVSGDRRAFCSRFQGKRGKTAAMPSEVGDDA